MALGNDFQGWSATSQPRLPRYASAQHLRTHPSTPQLPAPSLTAIPSAVRPQASFGGSSAAAQQRQGRDGRLGAAVARQCERAPENRLVFQEERLSGFRTHILGRARA